MSDDYKATYVRARLHYVLERCRMLVPDDTPADEGTAPADVQAASAVAARGLAQLSSDAAGAALTALTADSIFMRGLLRMLEPTMDEALRQRIAQSERAKRRRGSDKIGGIIESLARHEDSVMNLWNAFYGELESSDLEPELHEDGGSENWRIEYRDNKDKRRTITFKTFGNKIGAQRRKQKAR